MSFELENDESDVYKDWLPEWAESKANGNYKHIRCSLETRDGRRTGNAVNAGTYKNEDNVSPAVYNIVTDAGNIIRCTEDELKDLFYPPKYVMKSFLPSHKHALEQEGLT